MKKLLLLLSICFCFSQMLNAQAIIKTDTVNVTTGRNQIVEMKDSLYNTLSKKIGLTWDANASVIPTGFNITSICTDPGQCYTTFNNVVGDSIAGMSNLEFKVDVNVAANASLTQTAYIVISTDVTSGNKMVFAIKAIEYSTSVKNNFSISNINMYPSPASTILNIIHNNDKVSKAVVYNVIGKKMATYNTPFGEKGFSIPVNSLTDGIYFIEIQDKNGNKLALKKFIKN